MFCQHLYPPFLRHYYCNLLSHVKKEKGTSMLTQKLRVLISKEHKTQNVDIKLNVGYRPKCSTIFLKILCNVGFWSFLLTYMTFLPCNINFSTKTTKPKMISTKDLQKCKNCDFVSLSNPTRVRFHQHFTSSFNACRSQKHKKFSQVIWRFCTFGICGRKRSS